MRFASFRLSHEICFILSGLRNLPRLRCHISARRAQRTERVLLHIPEHHHGTHAVQLPWRSQAVGAAAVKGSCRGAGTRCVPATGMHDGHGTQIYNITRAFFWETADTRIPRRAATERIGAAVVVVLLSYFFLQSSAAEPLKKSMCVIVAL